MEFTPAPSRRSTCSSARRYLAWRRKVDEERAGDIAGLPALARWRRQLLARSRAAGTSVNFTCLGVAGTLRVGKLELIQLKKQMTPPRPAHFLLRRSDP